MQQKILNYLLDNLYDNYLPMDLHKKAAQKFQTTLREVEKIALKNNITPLRYKRNQSTICVKDQLKLLESHIAIIGCGGLGGHIAEILTRIGVGKLSLFDFDIFEEHNLNRQNFSNYATLGREKVLVAKEELERINPSIQINAYVKKFKPKNDLDFISTANVVIDALDNPGTKLELSIECKENGLNFVHGAIAGLNGQFCTNLTLENLYKTGSSGIEKSIGNPSFSVTFAASVQCSEAIKIILGLGKTLGDHIMISNLLENEFILI
ncbi:MAG: HesA/MoeB/ThiF family protein [Sulfurospirillaceae bacterium]|nr:HesA/MoeB/ThiF family protein [Sulfurospirillaceae bacterium]